MSRVSPFRHWNCRFGRLENRLLITGLSANRVFWKTNIQTGRSPVPLDSVYIRGSVPSSELRRGREGTESARAPRRLHGTAWRKSGRSWGARCSRPRRNAHCLTTYQTTFSDIPRPQAVPCLLTALKTFPSVTFAASIHLSTSFFTHVGKGTVRT
jgi:hypothetical protein